MVTCRTPRVHFAVDSPSGEPAIVRRVPLPRRYLMVWTGAPLPFIGALAVERALQIDPGAVVEVHLVGDVPVGDHLAAAAARWSGRLELHRVGIGREFDGLDALTAQRCRRVLDGIPPGAGSARSNLIRYALLHRRGGVYLDTDVLLVRPVDDLAAGRPFVGLERVWRHDRARVEGRWTWRHVPGAVAFGASYSLRRLDTRALRGRARASERVRRIEPWWAELQPNNAVIGAPAGSDLTGRLLERAAGVDPRHRYSLGPSLLHDLVAAEPEVTAVLPERVLYPVPPSESHRFFDDRTLVLDPETVLVHYVASNHRALVRSLHPADPRIARRPEVAWAICRQALLGTHPERAAA